MPHSLDPLVCFNGGEISPTMDARLDLPAYRKSCRKLRNLIPTKQGGAVRKPGSVFIANGIKGGNFVLEQPAVSRLQKFQYAPGTAFMLEFGHKQIRFYSNGQQVQVPPPPDWVSGTSYPAGAFVNFSGVTYFAYAGAVIGSITNPLSAPFQWVAQTAYAVPSPYLGTNFVAPSYWDADVFVLQCLQINDVVYIAHPNFPVYKLTRFSDSNWVMQITEFITPAMLDENFTDTTLAATAITGTGVGITATAPAWVTNIYYVPGNSVLQGGVIYNVNTVHTSGTFSTDLANGFWTAQTIFQSGHVGSYWQLAYNRVASFVEYDLTANGISTTLPLIGTWEIQTYGVWQAWITIQVSYDQGITYQVVTTLTSKGDANYSISGEDTAGGIYRMVITNWVTQTSATPPRVVLTADNQFIYGLIQITAVAGAYSATANVITALLNTSATIYWSEGAWSNVRGFPTALACFQERVWYGGTRAGPQDIWATQTDDIENFALVDQSQATYGLKFTLNAAGRGPIEWFAAQTDFFVGLASAEWILTSGQTGAAITANAILALEHSAKGSAPALPGIIIENAAFYVQRRGKNFQQFMYSVFTNKYMSQDMQVLSQHLTAAGVKQFDYQQQFENQSLIWAVCGDGTLISLTYAMEQEVFGWAKHTTGDGIDFGYLSVQVIYGSAGQDDEVWVSCYRAGATDGLNTFCTIERLNPVDWQTSNLGQPNLKQAVFADCSVVVTSPPTNVISGISPVLNQRVCVASLVQANGLGMASFSNLEVTGGTVTLPNYVPAAGDVVVVGLPINWALQPMRLDVDPRAGETPGIRKALSKLYLRVVNSIGGQWATKEGEVIDIQWYPITTNTGALPPFYPNLPLDLEIDVGGLTEYADDPQFTIQGFAPLPFFILGISVKYDIGGAP